MNKTIAQARKMRLAVVRAALKNFLDEADALELLRGELTPGKPSTAYDDSELLYASEEQIANALNVPTVGTDK